jgi:hypothetical protein
MAAPAATPTATPAVIWAGKPAVRMSLQTHPLGVSPDGEARWLVQAKFWDARGLPTTLVTGGDVAFHVPGAAVQWQTRLRFGGPSAIVSTRRDDPLDITVATNGELGSLYARAGTQPRRWQVARVVGAALGPHLVQFGWFPCGRRGTTAIVRSGPDGTKVVGLVGAPASTYRDVTVAPATRYRYVVIAPDGARTSVGIAVPPEAPLPPETVSGKGVWLSFSPRERDDDAYTKLDPAAVVEQAERAGLRFIELRTAYGEYWEVTPQAKATIDALIDLAAGRNISVVGWTVPRAATFDDLSLAVRSAFYETPNGNHLAGLAVDLERGEEFMGDGPRGYAALTDYLRLLRAALGPRYPLIATVEDPSLEHLTRAEYPYDAIAASATILQPMTYWGVLAPAGSPAAVRGTIAASYATLQRLAGRAIPIELGAQTTPEGPRAVPPDEIKASLAEAKVLGLLGVTFFDWKGTRPEQWEAIARYSW